MKSKSLKGAKTERKSLSKKKSTKELSVKVKFERRPNKHLSYIKIKHDEEAGNYRSGSSDGVDGFYMGTHDLDLTNRIVEQVASICFTGTKNPIDIALKVNASMAAILEIDPQDSTELMLATQMVTVHNVTMEMSRRALLSEQTEDGVNSCINRTTKLMRTYMAQMEALNKYRNKGKQKITVTHVNVADGGQAIVGDVNQGGG